MRFAISILIFALAHFAIATPYIQSREVVIAKAHEHLNETLELRSSCVDGNLNDQGQCVCSEGCVDPLGQCLHTNNGWCNCLYGNLNTKTGQCICASGCSDPTYVCDQPLGKCNIAGRSSMSNFGRISVGAMLVATVLL